MSLFGFHRLQSKYVNRHLASVPHKLHRHIILSQSPFHALFNSKLQCQGKCKCCSPEPNSWRSSQGRIGQVQPLSLINIWAMQASRLGRRGRLSSRSRPMNPKAASSMKIILQIIEKATAESLLPNGRSSSKWLCWLRQTFGIVFSLDSFMTSSVVRSQPVSF